MNKIYLVTDGEYSDYHIIGVYTTKELAEEAVKCYTGYSTPGIEEYDLDTIPDHPPGLYPFQVIMNRAGDGEASRQEVGALMEDKPEETWTRFEGMHKTGNYSFRVWASDNQHAIKIANERRAQLIAFNNWPETK